MYGVHYNDDYYKDIRYRDILISDLRDLHRIMQFAEKIKPEAIISDQCDYSNFAQAFIAERLGLPGPQIKSAQITNSKYLQRKMCCEAGIPCPSFSLCTSVDEVRAFGEQIGYPIMVKPSDNRGSFGVNRVNSADEVDTAFYEALENCHSRLLIAEKCIEGQHITVDGYVFRDKGPLALAVATKKKLPAKNSIIDGEITYPGELTDDLYEKCKKTLELTAQACGFVFGFLHGEFILTADGEIFLTEIANRGGGVYTSEVIVPHVSGIDVNAIYINDCFGENVVPVSNASESPQKNPVVMKLFAFSEVREGVLKAIRGVEEIERRNDVLKLRMLIRKGDVVRDIQSGADRHGVIIMTNPDLEMLKSNLNEVIGKLEVDIEGY
ncbi:ATP-grasp domain-containing protein [Pseudodesulfovibrio piezophilus]|uniref:ATP-grasp domain-containing protein n=1 Tax=Pseudodesulfovibrio piezophilus TaxID=879567 RepID=UPI001E60EA4E|nr:ATP-grasp domain-containing protein [Pseudodesulfovibrio piezophilus]